jgi:crotonobetainyl-CoA:carnitine CoA-transferase CaiB-like acyl-CoA transferase
MQSNELVRFAGRPAAEVGARDYRGPSALSRYYRCADAWIRVHVTSPETFVAADLISEIPDADALLANALSVALGQLRRDEAVGMLRSAGALVAVVRDNKELLIDPATHASGHVGSIRWPDGNETFMPRQFARFGAHPEPPELTAPGIGEHSRTILRAAGIDSGTVAELMSAGVVAEREPLHSVAFTGYR